MKSRITLVFALLFCAFGLELHAQSRLKMELYGGPQLMYQRSADQVRNPPNYHLGINWLYGVKEDFQVVLQAESTRANFNYDWYPTFPSTNPSYKAFYYDSFGNFRLGLRKSWEKGSKAFFIQPNVGITVNNFFDFSVADSTSFFMASKESRIVGNLGVEAGVKFYTGRRNYITLGIRHQSGLNSLNPAEVSWGIPQQSRILVERSGTYTGLFVGYGIDFKGRTREERADAKLEKLDQKTVRRERAWGDGMYLSIAGALRFRPKSERVPNLEFSHISGAYQYGIGYTMGHFSLESGYGRMVAFNHIRIPEAVVQTQRGYTVEAIPLRLRYHRNLGDKNRLRVGASFAANYTLATRGLTNIGQGGGNGNGFTVYQINSTPLEQTSKGKVFFNAGLFGEIPVFNSGKVTFNFSRNFGSPAVGRENISGMIFGSPVNQELTGTLDGWIMEVGYKIPIGRFFR
ncbi:hypothetical protein CLV31_103268 [Algoriphagus aquaeductus]|uniref:Uncharacterized protein n=1 Tax=Algoriphagus aquaeductus TaxID=475299 RepID=A0A326S6J3_9BACT|nr:hypothetical protein [Algoriphagus aquaeductus]PZV85476.1 hypothetical protein CLV31_103268 [Algoriphagus aquaeductus]